MICSDIFGHREPSSIDVKPRSNIKPHQILTYEPFIATEENGVEHRFVQQEVAHPFANDHVDLIDRQRDLFGFALNQRNAYNDVVFNRSI